MTRVILAVVVAVVVFLLTPAHADVGFLWRAARDLANAADPYAVAGAPFLYPLPAAVLFLPTVWLPESVVTKGVTALCAAAMTLLLPAHRLPALLSVPFVLAVRSANPWAMLALAGLGWVAALKPNVGGVAVAAAAKRRDVAIVVGLVATSFLLFPLWPVSWFSALSRQIAPHLSPLLWPGGVIGLLGVLRWRTREGRALAAVTVLPSSALPYDLLTLHLCARTAKDSWVITGSGWLTFLALTLTAPHDLVRPWTAGHLIMALGVLAPCAALVWRRSP